MGLDLVEAVMQAEETFGIAIGDDEFDRVRTAGDFHALVMAKLDRSAQSRCLSSFLFYRVRRALVGAGLATRAQVTLDAPMERLVPARRRREHWRKIGHVLALPLPELERPRWVVIGVLCAAGIPVLYGIISKSGWWWGAVGVVCLGMIATRGLRRDFPGDCRTVRDLVKTILARDGGKVAAQTWKWNEREAWETIKAIIVDASGSKPEDVVPEAHLIRDLNMG